MKLIWIFPSTMTKVRTVSNGCFLIINLVTIESFGHGGGEAEVVSLLGVGRLPKFIARDDNDKPMIDLLSKENQPIEENSFLGRNKHNRQDLNYLWEKHDNEDDDDELSTFETIQAMYQ